MSASQTLKLPPNLQSWLRACSVLSPLVRVRLQFLAVFWNWFFRPKTFQCSVAGFWSRYHDCPGH